MTDVADEALARGQAREIGPSLRDQLRMDPTPPPDVLFEESYAFIDDVDIPYTNYTSPEYAEAEYEHMWSRVWQWACHVDHIPEAGDYYVYDLGDMSAIVVRTPSGEVKGYVNSCMHRGTQLKQAGTCGFSNDLRCPYHGWRWSLDGDLIELPQKWDFPHVTAETHKLEEVSVDVWQGFVFVNFDPNAGPLEDYMGIMPRHWADWELADRYIETHVLKHLPCNWKAAAEAFLEAYHVRETHSTGKLGDEVTTAYDVFAPHVTRWIHTTALNSPLLDPPRSEQDLLDRHASRRGTDHFELPEGMRARDYQAKKYQEWIAEEYGRDFSGMSESMTLDSIEYFLFPNAFFFPGLQIPVIYRFRPDPETPDKSYFDLLMMRPRRPDGSAPPPPDPIELDIDDSYTVAEKLRGLGRVYDQDTANMAAQTRGFKASRKSGETLGNYQEVPARHLQNTVRAYIDGEL
ncbi:MAG: aromatic ring-hydroxylating oxygenase subunit alpha [Acidimicrobiales bacterium]